FICEYPNHVPFTDNHNNPIIIGRDYDDYGGMLAVIGGSNNHLLFITYFFNNISVFNLNTFQFIKHDTLPINDCINYHCFKEAIKIFCNFENSFRLFVAVLRMFENKKRSLMLK
ncbi:hypothetical protein RFI_35975, partial [Reticulomyxa filosa]